MKANRPLGMAGTASRRNRMSSGTGHRAALHASPDVDGSLPHQQSAMPRSAPRGRGGARTSPSPGGAAGRLVHEVEVEPYFFV